MRAVHLFRIATEPHIISENPLFTARDESPGSASIIVQFYLLSTLCRRQKNKTKLKSRTFYFFGLYTMKHKFYKLFFLTVLLCCTSTSTFALGVFDTVLQSYSNATATWSTTLLPVARYIFWTLSFVEFLYQLSIKKVLPNDIQKLWVFGLTRVIVVTLLSLFVLDLNTYTGIISWFCELGSKIGGSDLTTGAAAQVINYSPSNLFDGLFGHLGPTISTIILAAAATGLLSTSVGIFLFQLATVILACIFIIVIVVMLTLIEAYFVIFAGIILAGFAGSSWTMNYWQKYLAYVAGVAIRLFCTCVLLGLLTAADWSWIKPLPDTSAGIVAAFTHPGDVVANLLAMLGVFLFNMVVMVTLPSKAAAMLNGSINAGLGEAVGAAALAMSGGKMFAAGASGVLGGGAKLTQGAINAPAAAKSAGFKTLRNGMRNQISSGPTNADSEAAMKTLLKQQAAKAANNAGVNSVKEGVGAAKDHFSKLASSVKPQAGQFARHSNAASGPAAGGSSLNIDPHKHD